jgi:hypothetical protein
MPPGFAKDRDKKIGGPVQHLRLIGEPFGRSHVSDDFHDPRDPIETSEFLLGDC